MSQLFKPQTGYSRLLLSDGASLSHTNGVLNVAGSFSAGNLQVSDSPVGVGNPVHVSIVDADLDIRQLTAGTDEVTVSATALDIRALTTADEITVSATALDIRQLTAGTDEVTVSATDLDIRALTYGEDAIKALPQMNEAVLYNNVLSDVDSQVLDMLYCRNASFAGEVDGAITFNIEVSTNGSQFYASGSQIIVSDAGEFHANFETCFRYVRLAPSVDTVTCTIIGACM